MDPQSKSFPMGSTSQLEQAAARLGERQYSLARTRQLVGIGFTHNMIRYRVDAGRWQRRGHGVIQLGTGPLTRRGEWLAAVWSSGAGSVLTGEAGAELWGFNTIPARHIDVATPGTAGNHDGARYHRTRWFGRNDRTVRFVIPVASPMRVLVDMAELVDPYELIGPLYKASRKGMLRSRQLGTLHRRLRNRRHGYAALEFALAQLRAGSTGIHSYAELAFVQALREAELPLPLVNVVMVTDRGTFTIDMWWREYGVAAEIDDRGHDFAVVRMHDRGRDEALEELDVPLLRVPNELIFSNIEDVLHRVEMLLRAGGRRLG